MIVVRHSTFLTAAMYWLLISPLFGLPEVLQPLIDAGRLWASYHFFGNVESLNLKGVI